MKEGCRMVQRGRWSGIQQSDGYHSVWTCVSERYCWSGKTGKLKRYHLLGGRSSRLVIRAGGLDDMRMVSTNLMRSIVRICSSSAVGRGIKTSRMFAGIQGNLLTRENKT